MPLSVLEKEANRWRGALRLHLPTCVALLWAGFQLYSAYWGGFEDLIQRPLHVGFAIATGFLAYSLTGKRRADEGLPGWELILAFVALFSGIYLVSQHTRLTTRMAFIDDVTTADRVLGIATIILLLEVCRRTLGITLVLVALSFLIYGFVGPYLPGVLRHRGISIPHFVDLQFLSTNGIFGIPIGVSADMVFYFVLVGTFLERSGAGDLFISTAYWLTARARGGSAKASVVSSSLFGTVSGSAVANVLVDGWMTIPLMKRTGFSPSVSGAIEAVASTGGQIMPPVMGAAAFVLAQIVGVSYWDVVVAAIVPGLLYYLSLYFMVDLYSVRCGLRALRREEIANLLGGLTERLHLFLPLAFLVYLLSQGYTLMRIGLWTVGAVALVSLLRRSTRMGFAKTIDALSRGAREAINVAIPSAVAGIIIGMLVYTGLVLKFKTILVTITGGYLLPSLGVAMVATLILGMGMPTTAAYLLSAILVAPALVELGVPALSAHLFIFYFACVSMVTPPVALAAFAAAGISGGDLWRTGMDAFRFSLAGFLVPYAFVLNGGLLLKGPVLEIVWVIASTGIGVVVLASAVVGQGLQPTTLVERIALFVASVLLIYPERITDLIGLGIGIIVMMKQTRRPRLLAEVGSAEAGSQGGAQ